MGDLFDGYPVGPGWDEMFGPAGDPRPEYAELHQAMLALSATDLDERNALKNRSLRNQGITFSFQGEERPLPLDLLPRIIPASEWGIIEFGVAQRVRALEAFLHDVYGGQQILDDGLIPRHLVTSATGFLREASFLEPPNGVRVHVAGIDIVRGGDGRYVVLEDNLRVPSGISYVVENRRTMARVFPELFSTHRVRPVSTYPAHLLEALQAAAPGQPSDPNLVVLTPGIYNSAYFEHAFLARQMGVELVEGRDLVCRDNMVFMRTTGGEERVDVVYRRIDDEFLDPVQFLSNSVLGVPGILNAARAGNVAIANAVGNGVADDKAIYPWVPAMIRYYLGEEPCLDTVPTYRLDQPDQLEVAFARMDRLVWKPVAASGGQGLVIGPHASDEELMKLRDTVLTDPRDWIAQEVVQLSTSPTQASDRLAPRHIDLRPFAVNDGRHIWVVPGGLTRVALVEGSLVVNSSAGGGSKDTWVLTDPAAAYGEAAALEGADPNRPGFAVPRGPVPEAGPPSTAAQQQQQQQQQQQPSWRRGVAAPC
jgi:uncharacterized circularly permuted ATP-grasp superfamily protein